MERDRRASLVSCMHKFPANTVNEIPRRGHAARFILDLVLNNLNAILNDNQASIKIFAHVARV